MTTYINIGEIKSFIRWRFYLDTFKGNELIDMPSDSKTHASSASAQL
jgi:hypothetical protein